MFVQLFGHCCPSFFKMRSHIIKHLLISFYELFSTVAVSLCRFVPKLRLVCPSDIKRGPVNCDMIGGVIDKFDMG